MLEEAIKLFSDLGGTLGSLAFSFWLVRYLLIQFAEERKLLKDEAFKERQIWIEKDNTADAKMLELQKSSYNSLMNVIQENNKVLGELCISLNDIKTIIQYRREGKD
jgi:hypothetical protein